METVFLSLTKSDFQASIAETVNACLIRNCSQQIVPDETDRWFDLYERPSRSAASLINWNTIVSYYRRQIPCPFTPDNSSVA